MEVTVLMGWVEKKIRCLRCSHSKTNVGGRDEVNFHPTNIGPVVTSLLLLVLVLVFIIVVVIAIVIAATPG